MRYRRRIATASVLAATGLALTVGCADLMDQILGSKAGLLLYGFDVATTPGTQVNVQAKLAQGSLLKNQSGRTIRFMLNDTLVGSATTDASGMATIQWTPTTAGDHVFTLVPEPLTTETGDASSDAGESETPEPVKMLVACRKADAAVAIIDLDQTLVASGFWDVFSQGASDPLPMEGSEAVAQRMAKDYFVIYLTHRPDQFAPKSKGWLEAHGYPSGPVILSRPEEFAQGSGTFKTDAIRKLGEAFTNLKVGVGDKYSDVEAYHANNMKGILILPPLESPTADSLERQANEVEALPDVIQVVESWAGVEEVLYKGASYPRARRVESLRKQAAALKTN